MTEKKIRKVVSKEQKAYNRGVAYGIRLAQSAISAALKEGWNDANVALELSVKK